MNEQPEALRLADALADHANRDAVEEFSDDLRDAAAELRRLHEENQRLAAEVANRNRRALEGDKAVVALDRVHAYYEGLHAANQELLGLVELLDALQPSPDYYPEDYRLARAAIAKHGGAQ